MEKAIRALVLVLLSCCFALLASGQITSPPETEALRAIQHKLKDPHDNLRNWTGHEPCVTNWTGVICTPELADGFRHVQELRMQNLNLSGELAPELGQLSNMITLNFMWNQDISGSIPKEISNLKSLEFLLLSGNNLSGPIPGELGDMPSLLMFQADANQISGSVPTSFANLKKCRHLHMNNNSMSGQLPPEIFNMTSLIHILFDNNELSGHIPSEYLLMPSLRILQLDNNNFGGTEIPSSYSNESSLVKLSLRNCNLTGAIPDFSGTPLRFLDLSQNQLTGEIPTNKLSNNITTIYLSYNLLNGSIPENFSVLPRLQKLFLQNNSLSGAVPNLWQNRSFNATEKLKIDLRNNSFSNISGSEVPPSNVTIMLDGNPACTSANLLNKTLFCTNNNEDEDTVSTPPGTSSNSNQSCSFSCPSLDGYELVPDAPLCFCAVPFQVVLRLRSPTISYFPPYINPYIQFMTKSLNLFPYQLFVALPIWEVRRLRLYLKFYPTYSNSTGKFNNSEIIRITGLIANFRIPSNDTYGPYELIEFPPGPYTVDLPTSKSGLSKGALIGIILGAISLTISLSLVTVLVLGCYRRRKKSQQEVPKKQPNTKVPIRAESMKEFSFLELEAATNGFSDTAQIGQGGYGKVFRGVLANGMLVAIKRARQGSLQGQIEFITEIEMLSRLHHRNLVSLVGYCGEQGEQMLVYEFMPNGSLHDHLSARYRHILTFPLRMRIALGAAKGILYLHTEADPPIIHRDIKANNILLDSKFTPKVSDFGISRLAPVPDAEGGFTHVSTVVKGTPGYLDPEYFLTHKLTEKSDVYSLGIVFLELLTGMMPISHGKNIVREVQGACQSGLMFSIIDRSLGSSHSSECIKKFMALALKCCQDDPKDRPTMLETVRELENLCSSLPDSDVIPTDSSDAPSSVGIEVELSGRIASSPLYSGKNLTTEVLGSELISGVMPTIKPR